MHRSIQKGRTLNQRSHRLYIAAFSDAVLTMGAHYDQGGRGREGGGNGEKEGEGKREGEGEREGEREAGREREICCMQ